MKNAIPTLILVAGLVLLGVMIAAGHGGGSRPLDRANVDVPSLRGSVVEKVEFSPSDEYYSIWLRPAKKTGAEVLKGLQHDLPHFRTHQNKAMYFSYVVGGRQGSLNVIYNVMLAERASVAHNDPDKYRYAKDSGGVPVVRVFLKKAK